MIHFTLLVKGTTALMLGYIPLFLNNHDPRPAREQFNSNYKHGGWQPIKGFKMLPSGAIKYPNDPVLIPFARAQLRKETIFIYPASIVAILQEDGTFEVARMD